jgi:hypothetical protein
VKRIVTEKSWNAGLPIRKTYNRFSIYRKSWNGRENERGTGERTREERADE